MQIIEFDLRNIRTYRGKRSLHIRVENSKSLVKSNSVAEKRTASYTKNFTKVFFLLNSTRKKFYRLQTYFYALICYPVAELPEAVGESMFTQQSGDCHCPGDLPILDEVFVVTRTTLDQAPLTI